ncbi:MAG TPA: hypothetical protein VLC92_02015 [Rhodocyclaceae bacterium]|nr:hypothetical protein [Rhodocyclaceae bacterium]
MNAMHKTTLALSLALAFSGTAMAGQTGGFSTADGGNKSGALARTATSLQGIIDAIAEAKSAAKPLVVTYTGNEDSLIAAMVANHTKNAAGACPSPHWSDAYRKVEVSGFTYGLTILGANGSSANFGIVLKSGSSDVIIRNMKIGALAGAANDADMIRIDGSSNVWVDHNELFAVNNECSGSPDGDLTFESALDIKGASHNITVSYNHIHDSKKVGLDGSSNTDIQGGRKITFHHNVYYNVNGRLPLQRGGWTHMYNNTYDKITLSGINVRQAGYSLIEKNWFQNSIDPVVCFFDGGSNCGFWDLRNNNINSPADFATYGVTWSTPATGDKSASAWTTTGAFPLTLPYTYEPVTAQCAKDKLASYAGVGKDGAQLTAASCGASASSSSSSAAASSAASSSSSSVSSSSASSATSSAASSAASSSSSASGGGTPPVLAGTGDYPTGFSKCADLGGTCSITTGTGWVAFGRGGKWVLKYVGVGSNTACTVAVFGSDPGGNPNKCSKQN